MKVTLSLVLVLGIAACGKSAPSAPKATAADCNEALDQISDLTVKEAKYTPEQEAETRATWAKDRPHSVELCTKDHDAKWIACIKAATSSDAVRSCTK